MLTNRPFPAWRKPSNVRSARARRTIQRLAVRAGESDCRAAEKESEGRGAVRDRLRSVGAAAYRHLRRGRAHHHGAPCLSRAHRGQDQDPADCVLRRHGWIPQSAGQFAEQGDAGSTSRPAAHPRARSVRHPSESGRSQQCPAARVSRHVWIRLRVRQFDRLLHFRKIRRDPAAGAGAHREGDGGDAAVPARGACGELFAVPADLPAYRRGAVCADHRA